MKRSTFRRPLAILLCLLMVPNFFTVGGLAAPTATPRFGDINADDGINAADALLALQHSVKLITLTEEEFAVADVAVNDLVDATDALYILQYSVKLKRIFEPEAELYLDQIRTKMIVQLENSYASTSKENVQAYLSNMRPNGSWSDIDYNDQSVSNWKTTSHLALLLIIAASSGREILAADEALRDKLILGLDYWLERDPQNPNWWYNDLDVPKQLSHVCLFLWDYLDEARQRKCELILSRGTLFENFENDESKNWWTGTNLLWGLDITIKHALVIGDAGLLIHATDLLDGLITVGDPEGIQTDYSFFQHGSQLAMGHYGWNFVHDPVSLFELLAGTPLQIRDSKLALLTQYLTDGTQYVVYKNYWNYFSNGRSLFRNNSLTWANSVAPLMRRFAALEELTDDQVNALLKAADKVSGKEIALDDRYFDVGKYYVRSADNYYISTRVTDPSIIPGEIVNYEGILGYNLATGGVQCILVNGDEYNNIAPIWDYAKIPGVTTLYEDDASLRSKKSWNSEPATNTYCGGMTDGNTGVVYMDLFHNGIYGVTSRFFVDDGMIALGAGLNCLAFGQAITTVNQCWHRSDVMQKDNVVVHDNVTYLNLCSTPWQTAVEHRTGSWKRVASEASDTPIEGDVFSLWYDHGEMERDTDYAYAVFPNRSDISLTAEKADIEILQNTADIQAIRTGDKVIAVFHTAGSLPLSDGSVLHGEAQTIQTATLK